MLWIRPIDITFQPEGGYFYFNQLFDLDSNNCINGIAQCTTIVTKIIRGGGRELTDTFQRFTEHYGFKPVFCNPDSGNEKGNVLYASFFYPHIL